MSILMYYTLLQFDPRVELLEELDFKHPVLTQRLQQMKTFRLFPECAPL